MANLATDNRINPIRHTLRKHSKLSTMWKQLRKNPTGMIGFILISIAILIGLLGDWIAPYDPSHAELTKKLLPPLTEGHLLGTDQLGRDILSRIISGTKISLMIGLTTVIFAGILGTTVGIVAGFFKGWVDTILMRIVDVQLSFPFILLVLVINAVIGTGLKNIILSLVFAGWVSYARVIRSEVLALREKEFILACISVGVPKWEILVKHIVPNLLTPIVILSSLQVASFIIAEASVSFLGFGVQPPQPAWGNMLNEGKDYIFSAWWLITFPGLAIVFTALGVNLFGDWLRDVLDPESKSG
ncbi:ABC transporter permease [Brevibacillus invocatus]|uniref:ABC transporter permease n=1 Tax=Brevibacillus invocatus TaxID=173959 RepID=UPI00203F11C7|nr:ABC transporter permease [Brevibacillus invocatus]MCM3082054.1 ABC transporter permease [Brevibacillus invocatus]MCM3432465.1 ABC transporter permease [Brevibacillus invocatus]